MVKKRRMFDIEMPEPDDAPAPEPQETPEPERRRGPMAAAIRETAESGRERRDMEASIRAENDALAHEFVRLKALGLMVDLVPLESVAADKLVRDRAKRADPELDELKASIKAVGLSNPIRVEETGQGGYELVQGFRRLSAYRELLKETGDAETWGRIPAAIMGQGQTADGLYRRMVDENLVRKDISFAEMAQLAVSYADDPQVEETDADRAVAELFQSAGYQKRSYIRAFIKLIRALGGDLEHMVEVPRALGLALVRRLDADPDLAGRIRGDLPSGPARTPEAELSVLRRYADEEEVAKAPRPKASRAGSKARTSFQFDRTEGRAKCTASDGRIEVRLDRDFSAIDPRRLERAVREMLDQLE